jgi:hypothetical protein
MYFKFYCNIFLDMSIIICNDLYDANKERNVMKEVPKGFIPQNITILSEQAVEITNRKLSTCTSVMTFTSG